MLNKEEIKNCLNNIRIQVDKSIPNKFKDITKEKIVEIKKKGFIKKENSKISSSVKEIEIKRKNLEDIYISFPKYIRENVFTLRYNTEESLPLEEEYLIAKNKIKKIKKYYWLSKNSKNRKIRRPYLKQTIELKKLKKELDSLSKNDLSHFWILIYLSNILDALHFLKRSLEKIKLDVNSFSYNLSKPSELKRGVHREIAYRDLYKAKNIIKDWCNKIELNLDKIESEIS